MAGRASWAGMTEPEWEVARKEVVERLAAIRDADQRNEIPTLEIRRAGALLDRSDAQIRRYVAAQVPCPDREVWEFPGWLVPLVYATGHLQPLYEDLIKTRDSLPHDDTPEELRNLPGSFSTFWRAWQRLPLRTREFGKKGAKSFRRRVVYLRWEATERNETWQADATQLDIWVLPQGRKLPVRPWLVVIIDDYSRMVMGAMVTLAQPNAEEVAACFVRALRPTVSPATGVTIGGVPGQVLTDNGSEFRNELLTMLAINVGFVVHPVARYTPTSKGKVERFIGSITRWVCQGLPGYSRGPRSYTNRDVFLGQVTDLLDEDALWAVVNARIEHYNFHRQHRALGCTPFERWMSDTTPITAADPLALRHGILLSAKRRRAEPDGVRMGAVVYVALDGGYDDYVGEWVQVACLPHDTSFIEIYDANGAWICTAYPQGSATLDELTALSTRRRKHYREVIGAAEEAHSIHVARAEALDAEGNGPSLTATALARRLPELEATAPMATAPAEEPDVEEWLDESWEAIGPQPGKVEVSISLPREIVEEAQSTSGAEAS
jgi:transposase InsO family protein